MKQKVWNSGGTHQCNAPNLIQAVKNIKKTYAQGGFIVEWLLMDGKFEVLQGDIANLGI